MPTRLRRNALMDTWYDQASTANPGLLLRRGLDEYESAGRDGNPEGGGKKKQALIERMARIGPQEGYRRAFNRWKAATADGKRFSNFAAPLLGRLYIGLSRETALETGITVQHAWGMPMIPGSALKGIARAAARERLADKPDLVNWLFGAATDGAKDDSALEAGAVVFHDAWWVPEGRPFVAEVVTPHHGGYYVQGGAVPATDFDSPIPASQIATQGSFYFVLEGEPAWCGIAQTLLQFALEERGVGGKRSSGYGYFDLNQPA